MDSLVVVVEDGHRNRFMEPREIAMSVQVAEAFDVQLNLEASSMASRRLSIRKSLPVCPTTKAELWML